MLIHAIAILAMSLAGPTPDAEAVVRDAIALQHRVFKSMEGYCYTQRILQEEPGTDPGRKREERLEQVCFREGVPIYKQLMVNGKPTGRKMEDPFPPPGKPEDWRKRVERTQEARKRDSELMAQVEKAFRFQLVEEGTFEGRPVWVVEMTPRPEYRPNSRATEMLKHVVARVWVDKETHHLAMIRARVVSDFNIWGGLAAKVRRGARFEIRQKPVNGVWLPYFREENWEARIALFKNIGEHVRAERSDFRLQRATAARVDGNPE